MVHGPLNLINMLDLWRDNRQGGRVEDRLPQSINYRATSPIYAGETYTAVLSRDRSEGEATVRIQMWGADGKMGMHGNIKSF